MNINLSLLGQLITFAIFVWFTVKFVWPPLMSAMNERRERIAEGLAAADQGKVQLEEAALQVKSQLDEAKTQAAAMLKDADRRAAGIIEAAKEKAREEGERLLESAQQEVDQAYLSAREKLIKEVSMLSVKGAEKILQQRIDQAANEALVDDMISELTHV